MNLLAKVGAIVALTMLLNSVSMAEWQGDMATVDGVVTVTNPESPAYGESTQDLREVWRRGGDDDEVFFGTIAEFLHDDDGNIYLLDGQLSEINVFDASGELLRTIGREGEGPGEFQNGADMFWAPGGQIGIVQSWPGKIVMITPDGDPGTTFSLPFRDGGGWQMATRAAGNDDNIVLSGTAWTREDGKQLQFTYLKMYDASGNLISTFEETEQETEFNSYKFVEREFVDFQRRWTVAPDGRVAAALSFDDYRVHVWHSDGSLDRVIERPGYQPIKRTSGENKRMQTMYDSYTRWNRGSTFEVSKTHEAIGQIFFRDDGTLWVQSGAGRWRPNDGVFTSFDVYDTVGRYVQRVDLIADADATEDGLFFVGDRAYVVTDLYNAILANLGGAGEDEDEDEMADDDIEPVSVIAFAFEPVIASAP